MEPGKEGILFKEFRDLWESKEEQDKIVNKLNGWFEDLNSRAEEAKKHRRLFRQWRPLRVYLSMGEIKKITPKFSLRFLGQEVGKIIIKEGRPILSIEEDHHIHNQKFFAKHYPDGTDKFCLKKGEYKWRSGEAKQFRRDFNEIQNKIQNEIQDEIQKNSKVEVGIPEHRIESAFIKEMELGGKSQFNRDGGEIKPVKIADCSLQMPLPVSASKGHPGPGPGHIDILARHRPGKGKKVNLSVWELKSPKKLSFAVKQACIYALTLRYILKKSEHGEEWYKLCGFKSTIPDKLTIEAVVAIHEDQERDCREQYKKLVKENDLRIEGDQINFFLALYDYDGASLKIKSSQPLTGQEAA